MANTTKTQAQVQNARKVVGAMQTLANDMQHRVDEFNTLVAAYADALDGDDANAAPEDVARMMTGANTVIRLLEALEGVTHIHTGSTDHMHYRQARDAILRHAAGDDDLLI